MFVPTHRRAVPTWLLFFGAGIVVLFAACGGGRTPTSKGGPTGVSGVPRGSQNPTFDATPLYRQMGMIARGLPFPVLGRTAFFAATTPETTHVAVAISFANTALTFAREADNRFRAVYVVGVTLARATTVVARSETSEPVLVGTYRETIRSDESVIHQEILDVAPGQYTLTVSVRDEGSQRKAEEQITINVPRLGEGALSTPMLITETAPRATRDSLPQVLLNPSGTAVVGRDSVLSVYLERYDNSGAPVRLLVRNERARLLWTDTVSIPRRGAMSSGIVMLPISRIGVGIAQLTFVTEGSVDSSSTFAFVGFGGELPVASFEDMLSFLRFFAAPYRLQRLRETPEEARPAAWAAFLRETDPDAGTAAHEALREYFSRIARANGRFREEATPGWLSDRGRVFITLGEPDQLLEPAPGALQRNRQQMWTYSSLNLQLVFYDQTGLGRWRLTQSSEIRFEAEFRRRLK